MTFQNLFSVLSGETARLWDVGPFFVSYRSEPISLEINKLLSQLRSLCTVLAKLSLF